MAQPPVIWVISDGKAGHEAQSVGLANALADLTGATRRLVTLGPAQNLADRLLPRAPDPDTLGEPDLVIGAGTPTHRMLKACKRRYGAKAVVLMRPSFGRFDLVVAPAHDGLRESWNVVVTRGAINLVRPSTAKRAATGLILTGGPSRHHGWDDAGMARQVRTIVERDPSVRWTLTTSRRTPATFVAELDRAFAGVETMRGRLDVHEASGTTREWLLERYAESERVWVSEDSVSMVYEALSSGARVGLLRVPRKGKGGRVTAGIDALARDGWVTWFEQWERSGALVAPPAPLDEATRVAGLITERFSLPGRRT